MKTTTKYRLEFLKIFIGMLLIVLSTSMYFNIVQYITIRKMIDINTKQDKFINTLIINQTK